MSFTLKDLSLLDIEAQHKANPNYPKKYLVATKFTDKTSAALERAICAYINLNGGMAERRKNTGRYLDDSKIVTNIIGQQMKLGSGRYIPGTGRNGTSDCSGIWKGRPIAIEVKIGKDRISEAQKEYQKDFELAGGVYIVAKDWNGFINEISKIE